MLRPAEALGQADRPLGAALLELQVQGRDQEA